MNERRFLLDASAALAFLFDEKGAARVATAVPFASISAVNLSEVVAKLYDGDVREEDIVASLADLDLEVVPFDQASRICVESGGCGSARLPASALALMDEQATELLASTISIWEVAVKWSLRKGLPDDMPLSGGAFAAALSEAGIEVLPVQPAQVAALDALPLLHRDPFDRFLLATARHEGLQLLTRDAALGAYGENVLVV